MNINFELYKIFYEVAKAKSISKGATKLRVSQPAITSSIKTLEGQLGGKLFTRTPKGVVLTTEGEELYKYIKEGMNYFINGTNKFMNLKKLNNGTLNIGASTTITENYLIPYIKKFHNTYPNIVINITNNLTDDLLKELRNGSLDIVISSIPDTTIKDLEITYLSDLHDVFVSGKNYKNKKYKNLKELLKEDLILQKKPSVTRNNFENFIKKENINPNIKMEVVSHNLLVKLTENNLGISVLTKEYITDKLEKTLFEIKTNKNIPKRKIGYFIKKDTYPTFTTQKFIQILKDH